MAAGRHLEYLCSRDSYRSWQVRTHYGPLYVAFWQISLSPNDILLFWEKYDKRLWLLDAILNILFLEVVRGICKTWVIRDLNSDVFAKFHLCFMKNEYFMNERIIQNGCRTPSWIYLCPRNSYRSWRVHTHYGPPYVALCLISALQNHFQTEPLKYVHCWATIGPYNNIQEYQKCRSGKTRSIVLAVRRYLKIPHESYVIRKPNKLISVNEIFMSLVQSKAVAWPVFHAFTECDCTGSLVRKGKLSFPESHLQMLQKK